MVSEQLREWWDVIGLTAGLHDDAVLRFFCHLQQKAPLIWNN